MIHAVRLFTWLLAGLTLLFNPVCVCVCVCVCVRARARVCVCVKREKATKYNLTKLEHSCYNQQDCIVSAQLQ